jgi:hypothetical protein
MIPLNTHNVLDYVIGAFLILAPALFGFSEVLAARNTFLALGVGMIGYSLITNYRYSLAKLIPLSVHMGLDVMVGVALILAPAIFDYRPSLTNFQYAVHFLLGAGAIGLVALTRPRQLPRGQVLPEDKDTTIRKTA